MPYLNFSIGRTTSANQVSLATSIPYPITQTDFDKYLNEISNNFRDREVFVWLALVKSSADFSIVKLECVLNNNQSMISTFSMGLNMIYPCRATRILFGTDSEAEFTIGVGN